MLGGAILLAAGVGSWVVANSDAERHDVLYQLTNFSNLSLEQKVQEASAIIFCKHKRKAGSVICIVAEILKERNEANFRYRIDDISPDVIRSARSDVDYGDGEVLFFIASESRPVYAVSVSDDGWLRGPDHISLDQLRMLAMQAKQ